MPPRWTAFEQTNLGRGWLNGHLLSGMISTRVDRDPRSTMRITLVPPPKCYRRVAILHPLVKKHRQGWRWGVKVDASNACTGAPRPDEVMGATPGLLVPGLAASTCRRGNADRSCHPELRRIPHFSAKAGSSIRRSSSGPFLLRMTSGRSSAEQH